MRSAWSTLSRLLESSGLFGGGDGPGDGGSDLRARFLAVAGDTRDPDALWDRMEASMDEDEIEAYVEDLELRGQRMVDHDDSWERRARTIRAAWRSGEVVSFQPSLFGDLADQPRTLAMTPYLEELLHDSVEEAWDSLRERSRGPASDSDDALIAALLAAARRMLDQDKLNTGRVRIEFDPVEVYVLGIGVGWVGSNLSRGPALGAATRDELGRSLRALVRGLRERDIGPDDELMRSFIAVYDRYSRLPKEARGEPR